MQDIYTLHGTACPVNITPTSGWFLTQGYTSYTRCQAPINFLSVPFRSTGTGVITYDLKSYHVVNYWGTGCANSSVGDFYMERVRDTIVCPSPGMTSSPYGTYVIDGNTYSTNYCSGTNETKNFGEVCCTVGNPINVGTGNKYQRAQDYAGPAGSPLKFERHYNSTGDMYGSLNRFGGEWIGQLGKHWRHTYDRRVAIYDSGTLVSAHVYRPDGKVHWFNLYNDQWYADKDVSSRLERIPAVGVHTGWRFTDAADDSVEIYDVNGKLQSITSRAGVVVTLAYSGTAELLSTATDSFGYQLQFGYDANGRLQTVIDPSGQVITYGYDGSGMLASVTYPDSATQSYLYNESIHIDGGTNLPHVLTGILDNAVRYATFKYLSTGRAKSSEHAGGAEFTSIAYPTSTTRTVTDALGTSRTYTVSTVLGAQRLQSISQFCSTCGATASTSYDANGNPSVVVDFNGNRTDHTYDLTRNLQISRTEALTSSGATTPKTRTLGTTWHSTYRVPMSMTQPGRSVAFTRDTVGNVLTKMELDTATSESRTWTYTYNGFGQVLTADGPRTDVSDVTTYTYYTCTSGYQCGQVNTVTNALGHVTTYNTYNAHGQPLTMTDANGVVTTLTYDLRQRLLSRTVGSELTSFTYWPTGLLKKATLPDGSYLEYTYDAAHRLTDLNDGPNNRIHYTLDAMGNRTAEEMRDPTNALRQTRTRVFNTLNQLYQELGAAGTPAVTTTYAYDNNGNQTSIAAPLSRTTGQTYDELNRLTTVTDPGSGVTSYGYNALDQLISVTDPRSLSTTYSYNALGDLKTQVSPDTGTTTNTYDSGGNLKTSTDARSAITTYTYDALNRLKSAAYKMGTTTDQTLFYGYDAGTNGKGRLTSASDASHSMAWTYDAQGRVTGKSQVLGSLTQSVGYGYSNAQHTTTTTPSGQTITYGYTNNQITSITVNGTTVLNNVQYEPFGPMKSWSWGNSTTTTRSYDQDGKITQIAGANTYTYAYDDAFRITGITDAANSALNWTYGYDAMDRLTSASKTGTTQGFTYDVNGNRLTQTGTSASTFNISPTSNKLTSISGALTRTYTTSSAGYVLNNTALSFSYNNRGRMKSSTKNTTVTNYTYNALGQLIKKTNGLYFYDESGHVLGQYTTAGVLQSEFVWLNDTPVAVLKPKAGGGVDIFYIHTDHLNTPKLVTQPSGNTLRWRWDALPFGGGSTNDNPSGLGVLTFELRFPGQVLMPETSNYYNYFRDYDPATGRYVQSDPIGLDGGINTYAYALNDPLLNIDPTGQESIPLPRPVPLPGWLGTAGTAGAVAGAGWAGWEIGSAVYPHISEPLGDLIDMCAAVNDDIGKRCDKQLKRDGATCRAVARAERAGKRPTGAGARCWASASQRYGNCLSGRELGPLDIWNN